MPSKLNQLAFYFFIGLKFKNKSLTELHTDIIIWSMKKSRKVRTGRHCVFLLDVHLVFMTKYRKNVFQKRHLRVLRQIFGKVCQDFDAELKEFNGESNHVHLLVTYPPKVAVSKLVNSLKGVSSRKLKQVIQN